MNIQINFNALGFENLCPHCLGTGKLKAMQMAMTYDAGTVRANDTKVKCKHCNGTGRKIKSQ